MGERSGVGLVELAILEALDARRAWSSRRPVSCLKLLLALEDGIGLARGYTHQVLIDLALPWKLPIPLIEGQGNFGSKGSVTCAPSGLASPTPASEQCPQ
jgi:hypothetical protein